MLLEQSRGIAPARRLENRRALIELLQDAAQGLPNQDMIIHQEKFHRERGPAIAANTYEDESSTIARDSKVAKNHRSETSIFARRPQVFQLRLILIVDPYRRR